MFYLGSIGGDGSNDPRHIRRVRATVGPGVLLYSEYCTDMALPYAGRYCEWVGPGQIRWTADNAYSILRPLCPKATGFASRGRRSSSPRPSPRGA